MKQEDIENAASSAVIENYGCNGEYPCTERNYCIFGNGQNTAFDCRECGADEFNDGFIAGAKWRINSVWHTMDEVQDGNRPYIVEMNEECKFAMFTNPISVPLEQAKSVFKRWAYIEDLMPEEED